MAKKKETYSVGDYIKTKCGLIEGHIVKVIDKSFVAVHTIDGLNRYCVPVEIIESKTKKKI